MTRDTQSRFTDLFAEPIDHLLCPIKGYSDKPLVCLTDSIKPISNLFNGIEDNVYVALHNCQNPLDGLTIDESAAIHLYTMQFDGGPSLFSLLNEVLRSEDREKLKPWFLYLKLFLTGLYKLPSQGKTLWRGMKNVDLSEKYQMGTRFVWWGVSSCTTHIQVLESDEFLGKTGARTIFSIECLNGKSVTNHSYYKNKEKEMILMPGSYFEVIGQLNPVSDLYIIQMKEILSPIMFVKPPFSKPIHIDIPVMNSKSNVLSLLFTRMRLRGTIPELDGLSSINSIGNFSKGDFRLTVAGGNGWGKKLNQLSDPQGIFIDHEQTIYIADCWNHRILGWSENSKQGFVVAGGFGKGNGMNQLNCPTDVLIDRNNDSLVISDWGNQRIVRWACRDSNRGQVIISDIHCSRLTMDKHGNLYVSDWKTNEVKRWKKGEKHVTVVAGGNGNGNDLNQLNNPTFIYVDENDSLYVSDSKNHRVVQWNVDAKEGFVVAGGNGQGNGLEQLSEPQGVVVDRMGRIYVADSYNHRIMCWDKEDKQGRIVFGGQGQGERLNQLHYPRGLALNKQGYIYVVDCGNHRVQHFQIE